MASAPIQLAAFLRYSVCSRAIFSAWRRRFASWSSGGGVSISTVAKVAAETSAAPFEFPLFERYGPDFLWWIKGRAHNRPLGSNGEGGEPGVADAA